MTTTAHRDEAMLTYLAGDDDVLAAAARIWDASGYVLAAQRELEAATGYYSRTITAAGIPADHAERLGAALMVRLHRAAEAARLGHTEPRDVLDL